ncbi:MAG TPA: glycosyltransferase [Ruminococcus sp.]|nr:glycosyltransferase [Ruminococcus sp.]
MNIYQIVTTLNFGDAIGNDVIAIKHVIEDMGLKTAVYSESIAPKVKEPDCMTLEHFPKLHDDDIVIYHMGNGSPLNEAVTHLDCRKIMIYHNITPYEFFHLDSMSAVENCRKGLQDVKTVMRGKFNAYIADSAFNKSDLVRMGYKADSISVIPVIVPFDDYKKKPDSAMVEELSDGMTNIVFVGRIAPNKKHEDLIWIFAYYKKYVNPDSRLILAGSANADGMYFKDLQAYIEELGVKDVVFAGHISFAEILAIYKTAHVFLCMSEHEGFCVPLLEAMTFDVPVIAYGACAVPETLGGAGVVVSNKDPVFLSKVIDGVVNQKAMRSQIIKAQRERLKYFQYDRIKKEFQDFLRGFIERFPPISSENGEKPIKDLYRIVQENMRKQSKLMPFTEDALLHESRMTSANVDMTDLLNQNYSARGLIEAVWLSCFGKLPDENDYSVWEMQASELNKTEFVKKLVYECTHADLCRNRGNEIHYNPFVSAELPEPSNHETEFIPEPEEGGALPT